MEIPAVIPADIELIHISKLNDEGRSVVARQLFKAMLDPATRDELNVRDLGKVVSDHRVSPQKNFNRLADLEDHPLESVYTAMYKSITPAGEATIKEGVFLNKQDSAMPGYIARRTDRIQSVEVPQLYVSGWVDATTINSLGYVAALTPVYEKLREEAPASWTTEPVDSDLLVHQAIKAAGYEAVSGGRYDHRGRLGVPPLSVLYIAK